MAIYYVDFDIETNPGYLVNDPNNPAGALELFSVVNPNNTLYIKGSHTFDGVSTLYTAGNWMPWNLSLYGPWRMRFTNFTD